jgi:hypothetical protein
VSECNQVQEDVVALPSVQPTALNVVVQCSNVKEVVLAGEDEECCMTPLVSRELWPAHVVVYGFAWRTMSCSSPLTCLGGSPLILAPLRYCMVNASGGVH